MEREHLRNWPAQVLTIKAMLDNQVPVIACCNKCGNFFQVELELLRAYHGEDYSLLNKRGQCKLAGCGGSCVFLYQHGRGLPFRPLAD